MASSFGIVMVIALVTVNFAIALLCFVSVSYITGFNRQINQLNRDLNRWTVLLENTLTQQTLALTQTRTDLRQCQLIHLQWQLQRRRLVQIAKFLHLVWFISKRQLP